MRRTLMLFGAAWPPVYMLFFLVLLAESTIRNDGDPDNDLLIPFGVIIALHIATMLIIVAAVTAYVAHAWRSPRIGKDERTLWVLVLLLGAPVAMPIYWWLHIRRDDSPSRSAATPSPSNG